jgi:type I restriction enzyme S subunit
MSFPRYPAYKDSGVEWLGEVPEHWSIIRLKNVLQCRITDGPHTTPEFIDEGVPFLSVDGIQDGEIRFDGCRFISEKDHEEFSRKAQPVRDDILMGKAASTGKIARVKIDFTFSLWSPLALIRVDSQLSSPSFYEQALKSASSQAQIDILCTSNTQKNICMDDIPRLVMTRPTIEEQLAIATFLDHETAKIDALIAEQLRLIELLQEKRQAVISYAVTKGLNPDAPMKDSGVEWLGEVPMHWGVTRLKHVTDLIVDCPHETPTYTEDGEFLVIRTADLDRGTLLNHFHMRRVDDFEYTNRIRRAPLERCDIVYGREGERWGHAALVPLSAKFCLGQRMMQFRCGPRWAPAFLMWLLNSRSVYLQGSLDTVGATSPHVNVGTIRNYALPEPPLDEQALIADSVATQAAHYDSLIHQCQQSSCLLSERRSALISAAVTGQIDVRGLVPR